MKLSERVRRLSSGYQGMDDQASIARDIDTLESENARLKEAVRVMREALEYQRRAWQWYVTGCQVLTDTKEMVKLADKEETTKMASIHRESVREALLEADRILRGDLK